MGWALAKQCIYCDPHFTVEETETFGQEETVSLRLEALLLKAPAHPTLLGTHLLG